MYDWYYNKLKKKYGENCTLLYTDTDSLLVDIKTNDIYKDMSETKEDYDFSDYPKDHQLHNESNKKVIGKMKDVCWYSHSRIHWFASEVIFYTTIR